MFSSKEEKKKILRERLAISKKLAKLKGEKFDLDKFQEEVRGTFGETNNIIDKPKIIKEEKILTEIKTNIQREVQQPIIQQTYTPPPQINISQKGKCPQCGLMHPPLRPGVICPMIEEKVKEEDTISREIPELILTVRDLIRREIEEKRIKDFKKFEEYFIKETKKIIGFYEE